MTPAMQAARDAVIEAAKKQRIACDRWCASLGRDDAEQTAALDAEHDKAIGEERRATQALLALEAQEKEQADAEG